MRFQLDETTARWFIHEFLRAGASLQFEPAFSDKLREAWDGSERVLDLAARAEDHKFFYTFIQRLVQLGYAQTVYSESFMDLARRVGKSYNPSIVDRLGSIFAIPPPIKIQGITEETRERAAEKVKNRRRLG